jgi:hypothetical protein
LTIPAQQDALSFSSPDAVAGNQSQLTPQQIESYVTKPTALESFTEGAKDLYNRASTTVSDTFSPNRPSMQQAEQNALIKADQAVADYQANSPKPTQAGAEAAWKASYESNSPGFFSKYAPLAAAGLGATYLAGGFDAPAPDDKPVYDPAYTGTDYMRDNPQAFSGSLYNYQSQGAGAYDPYRETSYAGGQGAAVPGVVTPTGIMQAQYSPEYGRRQMQQSIQRYYSPFIGTSEPIMAAKGGMVTTEPAHMSLGGFMKKFTTSVRQAQPQAQPQAEGGKGFFGKMGAAIHRVVADQQAQQQAQQRAQELAQQRAQELAQQRAQELAQPAYNPYRETMYAGGQGTASPGVILPTGILQAQYSPNYGRRRMRPVRAADGGSIREFPRKTGPINGPGTGTSDDIPAMLSDGEFVFTAKAVRNAGGGSRRKGAARMYKLMKSLEKGGMVKG